MAIEEVSGILSNSANLSTGSVGIEIPYLTSILQALGGIAVIYVVYLAVNTILNIKKNNQLKRMRELLEEINSKLNKKK